MVKLIVSDLDQTLLHTEKYISERTITTLRRCREQGVLIAYATARSTQASAQFLEAYMPDIFIGYGGGLAMAGDKVIGKLDISAELSSRLVRDCLAEPAITSVLAINEADAWTNSQEWIDANNAHYRLIDFNKVEPTGYLKVSVLAENPEAVERIAARYPMLDMLRYTGEDLYRFANREALKWNAVKSVAAHYGIDPGEIVAFGDDVNDLDMLRHAGIGVAMTNAIPAAKEAADFVCESNDEDGVARWLLENVLIDTRLQ
jgi:Cof subfamily protein (haloacid dehalogenase superfamily)